MDSQSMTSSKSCIVLHPPCMETIMMKGMAAGVGGGSSGSSSGSSSSSSGDSSTNRNSKSSVRKGVSSSSADAALSAAAAASINGMINNSSSNNNMNSAAKLNSGSVLPRKRHVVEASNSIHMISNPSLPTTSPRASLTEMTTPTPTELRQQQQSQSQQQQLLRDNNNNAAAAAAAARSERATNSKTKPLSAINESTTTEDSVSISAEKVPVESVIIMSQPVSSAEAATATELNIRDSTSNASAAEDEDEEEQAAVQKTKPLHERLLDEQRKQDLELAFVSFRNRQVLLSRLNESAPKGRLSLINLSRRGLGLEEAYVLKDAILANPQLSVLKLSYNDLGDNGATIIATAFQCSPDGRHHGHLSVLDLGFNGIGDLGCEAIALHALAANYTLRTLYLSGNLIKEKGALAIAGAILHGTGLSTLHLTANRIGPMGLQAIAGAINKNDLRIAAAAMAGGGGNLGNSALGGNSGHNHNPHHQCTSMIGLHVGSTNIQSDGFIAIPGMLLSNITLRSLCVSNNNLDDRDILLLSQALSQNKNVPLEQIILSHNLITCQGVECLMNSVWGSKTLREIKIDNNRVQDRGAQLCAVVLTSIPLEVLDLSFNRVTTVGIKALMKNISENSSLRWLGLCGIAVDQNASKAVSYALAYNTSLRELYMDNSSAGYSAQRHIVAGIVSNRRSSLRTLTGFDIGPIATTLGMPRLPEEWSNDQVLGFFRLMWEQWLLKSGRGNGASDANVDRGPAPPAAVAAAAKIALTSLGAAPQNLFQTEAYEKPITARAPVDPAGAALLERTESGTLSVPQFTEATDGELCEWTEGETKVATNHASSLSVVRSPLQNAERRNMNLQWLRLHFRSLSDVGRLPFNNADLWQLHQYYFSPPFYPADEEEKQSSDKSESDDGRSQEAIVAPPPTPARTSRSPSLGRAVSFKALGDALAATSDEEPHACGNKRRSGVGIVQIEEPASKRAKNLKPRIEYYPRIMAKIQSLGTKPMEQTLSLLRQLKHTENLIFAGRSPYTDFNDNGSADPTHSDIEMILLDLL